MACELFGNTAAGGFKGLICGRGSREKRKPCTTCGRACSLLCDHPVRRDGKETTCDRACCPAHSVNVGPDRDYCLAHARYADVMAKGSI